MANKKTKKEELEPQYFLYGRVNKDRGVHQDSKDKYGFNEYEYFYHGVTITIEPCSYRYDNYTPPIAERGDLVFVVVEEYSTGDSFNRVNRDYQVCGIFKEGKEAIAYIDNQKNKISGYFDRHIAWKIEYVVVT